MAVAFHNVSFPPLLALDATAPDGAVIGVIGEDGAGKHVLLRLAAGLDEPIAGNLTASEPRRLLGIGEPLALAPVGTLALDHALARHDGLVRARALEALRRLCADGTTVFFASHEEPLLRAVSDEVWWLHEGGLAAKGDPAEVFEKYNRHISRRIQEWGKSISQPLAPSLRRGDGRAEIKALETLDAEGQPSMTWQSGEEVAVRLTVQFNQAVEDPVVGIMIRTRIGFEVFGTNTELEKVKLGPCAAGQTLRITFRFRCDLCPRDYTITAASHDPDGLWHDWLEDAVAFLVTAPRYTAGVANLTTTVEVEQV